MDSKETIQLYIKQKIRKQKEEFGHTGEQVQTPEPKQRRIGDDQPPTSRDDNWLEPAPPLPRFTFKQDSSILPISYSPHSFDLNLLESTSESESDESDSSDHGDADHKPGKESSSSSKDEGGVGLREEC